MDEQRAALLTAVVAAQRPMMLKLATYWCRRSALDPEDLVQDACARMAERDVLPTDTRGQEGFARKWLQVAWASYWQAERTQKRGDAANRSTSLDHLTRQRDEDETGAGLQFPATETTESVACYRELQRAVNALPPAQRAAILGVPPVPPPRTRGRPPTYTSRFAVSRLRRQARATLRAAL